MMETNTESLLPINIVSIIKKMVKNPVKAGIATFLIYNILKPYLIKKKENLLEVFLYHGVDEKTLKKVIASGYLKKGTYVSKSKVTAHNYVKGGKGKVIPLDLKEDEFKKSGHSNQYVLTKDIRFKVKAENLDIPTRIENLLKEKYSIKLITHKTLGTRTLDFSGTKQHVLQQARDYFKDSKSVEIQKNGVTLVNKNDLAKYDTATLLRKLEKVNDVWKPFLDDKVKDNIESEIKAFINKVNKYALVPISTDLTNIKRWLSEQLIREQDNPLWKNLSSDKSSAKYFKKETMDKTQGVFFVKTDFLIRQAGNKTGGLDKEVSIRQAFDKNIKLPTPQYWLKDGNLGEGNHRVMVAKEKGLKSVPVRVYWK